MIEIVVLYLIGNKIIDYNSLNYSWVCVISERAFNGEIHLGIYCTDYTLQKSWECISSQHKLYKR